MKRPSRRHFLQGLGASTALLPLLDADRAQAAAPPKRLLIVVTTNGVLPKAFWPTGTETDFVLGETIKSFEDLKRDLLIVGGVNMEVFNDDMGSAFAGHESNMHLLTGVRGSKKMGASRPDLAGGISVDQFIVDKLNPPTEFRSLHVGAMVQSNGNEGRVSYRGAREPIPPEEDPYALFDRLFAKGGLNTPELDRLRAERQSVLDVVRRQLERYRTRVGAEDRRKIDVHHDMVREIEKQLATPKVAGACTAPTKPSTRLELNKPGNYPAVAKLQMDLVAAALACDLSRVVTLQLTNARGNNMVMSWLGEEFAIPHPAGSNEIAIENPLRTFHDITHNAGDSPEHTARKIKADTFLAEQYAYLVRKLKAIPEGNGTLLDNTAVVWMNNMSQGAAHAIRQMPWMIAGSCGGYFKTGRFVRLAKTPLDNFYTAADGVPHNRFLATLCHAMGVPVTTFGDPRYGEGPLGPLST